MKKHLVALLSLICAIVMVCSLPTLAVSPSPDECSLTVDYADKDAGTLSGVTFKLYTVARGHSGRYELTEAFTGFRTDLGKVKWDIGESVSGFASSLSSHIAASNVAPTQTGVTADNGKLTFSGLEKGLYIVLGEELTEDGWIYTPQPILLWLPCLSPDGKTDYNPVCEPKHNRDPETTERIVEKIWVGEGPHPDSVVVQLLRDGEVYETVTLNTLNNWRHVFYNLPGNHDWQIIEKDVPEGYTATVKQNGISFTITNTKDKEPPATTNPPDEPPVTTNPPDEPPVTTNPPETPNNPDDPNNPPKTGDVSRTGIWVTLMLIAAGGITITAVKSKRGKERN